jgi:hypothetical protein
MLQRERGETFSNDTLESYDLFMEILVHMPGVRTAYYHRGSHQYMAVMFAVAHKQGLPRAYILYCTTVAPT